MPGDFRAIEVTERIRKLREKTLCEKRYASVDQAAIITRFYREHEHLPVPLKRAGALAASLREIPVAIDPMELIVGNRTPMARSGVIFPEAGISWLAGEIEWLDSRPQDTFSIRTEDIDIFRRVIEPYWKGKSLEDHIQSDYGKELKELEKVVKINQKDHAQGHICPDVQTWLELGPAGLLAQVYEKLERTDAGNEEFLRSVITVLEASCDFINRYSVLARELAGREDDKELADNLMTISGTCAKLSVNPPESFREAIQAVWFLFVILQMESNASSFSPGRLDQYLYPWYRRDFNSGKLDAGQALELIDSLFIKFNQIVYMRNSNSAKYFAGFPTGFNISLGGVNTKGEDAVNDLSLLFLKAQDHVRLPQPNLSARLHRNSPDHFVEECTRVIGLGTGMPQIMNDESIIPALEHSGVSRGDAMNYAVVGCVELSSQGNFLGWSDAAMFNLVKVLELTLNNGVCMITGEQIGPETGDLTTFRDYNDLESAYSHQIDFFINRMATACEHVERIHQVHLPSPFLSSVTGDCLERGMDVTAGGAKYNFSGIQAIQVANIADSLTVLRELVYERNVIGQGEMLEALRTNFRDREALRQTCLNKVAKYGNDVARVDEEGTKWLKYFSGKLAGFRNYRGGDYHMGLYTVSAHVPMGANVGATPDGRLAGTPLADGGVSPMYGRDREGPTAVLRSVSRLPFNLAPNGTLLNMKFLPSFFMTGDDRRKFGAMIRTFIDLGIHHVQFNVVNNEDLIKAKSNPESYRGLTVRVAGYTAFFIELSEELQNEIIARTSFGPA